MDLLEGDNLFKSIFIKKVDEYPITINDIEIGKRFVITTRKGRRMEKNIFNNHLCDNKCIKKIEKDIIKRARVFDGFCFTRKERDDYKLSVEMTKYKESNIESFIETERDYGEKFYNLFYDTELAKYLFLTLGYMPLYDFFEIDSETFCSFNNNTLCKTLNDDKGKIVYIALDLKNKKIFSRCYIDGEIVRDKLYKFNDVLDIEVIHCEIKEIFFS